MFFLSVCAISYFSQNSYTYLYYLNGFVCLDVYKYARTCRLFVFTHPPSTDACFTVPHKATQTLRTAISNPVHRSPRDTQTQKNRVHANQVVNARNVSPHIPHRKNSSQQCRERQRLITYLCRPLWRFPAALWCSTAWGAHHPQHTPTHKPPSRQSIIGFAYIRYCESVVANRRKRLDVVSPWWWWRRRRRGASLDVTTRSNCI